MKKIILILLIFSSTLSYGQWTASKRLGQIIRWWTTSYVPDTVQVRKTFQTFLDSAGFSGSGTVNRYAMFTGSNSLGNGFLLQKGHNVTLLSGYNLTGDDTTLSMLNPKTFGISGAITLSADGNTHAKGFVTATLSGSSIAYNFAGANTSQFQSVNGINYVTADSIITTSRDNYNFITSNTIIKGNDATSSNYVFKTLDVSNSPLLTVRNDNHIEYTAKELFSTSANVLSFGQGGFTEIDINNVQLYAFKIGAVSIGSAFNLSTKIDFSTSSIDFLSAGLSNPASTNYTFNTSTTATTGKIVDVLNNNSSLFSVYSTGNISMSQVLANGSFATNADAITGGLTSGMLYYTNTAGEYFIKIVH